MINLSKEENNMSITTSEMTPADIRACTCGNDGYGNGGWGFGGDGAW
jgi:hypothetical protein